MKQADLSKWADAYVAAQEDSDVGIDHPLWWAIDRFYELMPDGPEDCWRAILAILDRTSSEKVLSILGAGQLEALIHAHGPKFIERIEFEARENPPFKALLGRVWESSTEDVWARVQRARGGR